MEAKQRVQLVTRVGDGDTIVMTGVGTIPIVTATAIRISYPATMKTTTAMKAKTVRRAVVLALAMWGVMFAAWVSVTLPAYRDDGSTRGLKDPKAEARAIERDR